MSKQTAISTLRRRLLGVLFIVVIFAFVALSIAIYNKSFSSSVPVTLTTDKIGNQLQQNSDVKVRGLIVGQVRRITPTERGAELELAIDPEKAGIIPNNVSARFTPKTLFGERFVDLQIPENLSANVLTSGDRIDQDRSTSAIELEQALENLLPVLQAVQPQKLSSTLTAISTALEGRGKPLGETLSELGGYVGELNPHLPQLQHDLRALADVADTYNAAAPDLVNALADLTVTSTTIADQRSGLEDLYGTVTTASTDLESFLDTNQKNLIQLADTSRPTLGILAKYSPEYPCFLRQMAETAVKANKAFGQGTNEPGLHAKLEIVVNRRPYVPGRDEPRYEDKRGPNCYEAEKFPVPFPQHPPGGPLRDGSESPPEARTSNDGLLPSAGSGGGTTSPSSAGVPASLPNSLMEQDFVAQLVAGRLGTEGDQVSAWQAFLVSPLFRGAEVTIK